MSVITSTRIPAQVSVASKGSNWSTVSRAIRNTCSRTGDTRNEITAAAANISGRPTIGVANGHCRPMNTKPPKTTNGRSTRHHDIPAGGTGSSSSAFVTLAFSPFQPR